MYQFLLGVIISLSGTLQRAQYFIRRKIKYKNKNIIIKNNDSLRNKYGHKKCYILGNGPSLAKHDLSQLANEDTFVVNNFFMHKGIEDIKPKFYVLADPVYWERVNDAEMMECWNELSKTTGLGINYMLPVELKDTIVHRLLKNESIYFIDISLPFYPGCPYKFDLSLPVNGTQNVLALSIQIAMYMGFDQIYLLGADHDWLSNYGKDSHFYDSTKAPLYNVSGTLQRPYYWWLEAVHQMFWQYREINSFAKSKGIKIFNASEAGVLDVFPFIAFKEALNKWQ